MTQEPSHVCGMTILTQAEGTEGISPHSPGEDSHASKSAMLLTHSGPGPESQQSL